jgi:hypothetical protein
MNNLAIEALPERMPYRFPIGAIYVVEGYGGEEGRLRVISRYIVLPDGRRINVPGDVRTGSAPAARSRRARRPKFHLETNRRQPHGKSGPKRARKKIVIGSGTG